MYKRQVLERKPIERQEEILFAIVLNVLGQAIKEKKYDKTNEIINLVNQIKVVPELFLYREMLTFYEELIAYHYLRDTCQKNSIVNCNNKLNT